MGVPQYTTPTFTLTFSEPSVNLLEARDVYVTFRNTQTLSILTKTGSDLTVLEKSIDVRLSQDETAKFGDCVEIQANWMLGNERIASNVVKYPISMQLLQRVIE